MGRADALTIAGRRSRLRADAARRQKRRGGRRRSAAAGPRAAGSPCFAGRAIMAATAMSPRDCCANRGLRSKSARWASPRACAATRARPSPTGTGRSLAAETLDPRGFDLVIDALFGAGLSRPLDGLALGDRRAHQRQRDAGAGGGRALGTRRRKWRHRLAGRAGARDRDLFPPQARPSAAAGPDGLRQGAADPDRHRRRGFARDRAAELSSTPRRSGAARCLGPRKTATNMRAAIWSSPRGPMIAHRGGAARRPRRPAGRGGPRHRRQSGATRWRSTPRI